MVHVGQLDARLAQSILVREDSLTDGYVASVETDVSLMKYNTSVKCTKMTQRRLT